MMTVLTFRRVLLQAGPRPPADGISYQENNSAGDERSQKQQHENGRAHILQHVSRTRRSLHLRVTPVPSSVHTWHTTHTRARTHDFPGKRKSSEKTPRKHAVSRYAITKSHYIRLYVCKSVRVACTTCTHTFSF